MCSKPGKQAAKLASTAAAAMVDVIMEVMPGNVFS